MGSLNKVNQPAPVSESPATESIMRSKALNQLYDGEIVISGISGKFPEARNIAEFEEKLFAGVDMVTDDDRRWPTGLWGLPDRTGKLKNLDKFDAAYFNIAPKQVIHLDPQLRLLYELTHEAFVDGGINPMLMRGSRTGVFVGVMGTDAGEMKASQHPDKVNGYEAMGATVFELSNRLSFAYDLKGPSFTLDTACSSSLYALNSAIRAIRMGECDGAIVAGCNLLLHPTKSLRFHRLGMLSPQGKCQSFDAAGDGYVRSEACVVMHIQKRSSALRSHATIVHIKTNSDGFKKEGLTYPSGRQQGALIEQVYAEAGVNPLEVAYVEAHGTGTQSGDPEELNAIARFFCKDRDSSNPLMVGSVKSNIGHTEGASGLCSLTKLVLAMRRRQISGNLHFKNANPKIPALFDGTLRVVDQNMAWNGRGYFGLNSFGVGGSNCHVILRESSINAKEAQDDLSLTPSQERPVTIVTLSGRTEEAVESALAQISSEDLPLDAEAMALLHKMAETPIPGHGYRGYTVIGGQNSQAPTVAAHQSGKRPLWFIFSGMGSQWPGMGRDLMAFKPFQQSILKSAAILKEKDIDLVDLIENGTEKTFQNVLPTFVTITAVQVALVDLLASLNVRPDGIVGHSVGELAASYADGSLSADQTVLAAWARGRAILDCGSKVEGGGMAAVGLSLEQSRLKCPPGIFPACHNSADSVTVAGPIEDVRQFVVELEQNGIFAKMVDSCGQAFHSPYIQEAGEQLRKYLCQIIPHPPLPRSGKWISSSVPESNDLAQFSSVDYHVNNLLSPVLFHSAVQQIPDNVIAIEVAPHGLLQAILRRSLHSSCHVFPLNHKNCGGGMGQNGTYFLHTIGKLFNLGLQPSLRNLYEKIEFPVSSRTAFLSPLVQWDHSTSWEIPRFSLTSAGGSGETSVEISLENAEQKFYAGHKIDGRAIMPATGYLVFVWKSFAQLLGKSLENLAVVFENLNFHQATLLPSIGKVELFINILRGTGAFQLRDKDALVVSGVIRLEEDHDKKLALECPTKFATDDDPDVLAMTKPQIYSELRLRGYDYEGLFQGVEAFHFATQSATLQWTGNWVTFLDTMLQVLLIPKASRILMVPTRIEKISIDPHKFCSCLLPAGGEQKDERAQVFYDQNVGAVHCHGVQIRGLTATTVPRNERQQAAPLVEEYVFTPYFDAPASKQDCPSLIKTLRLCVDMFMENTSAPLHKYEVVEHFLTNNFTVSQHTTPATPLAPLIEKVITSQPMMKCAITILVNPENNEIASQIEGSRVTTILPVKSDDQLFQSAPECHLMMVHDQKSLEAVASANNTKLLPQGFIIYHHRCQENNNNHVPPLTGNRIQLVAQKFFDGGQLLLYRRKEENDPSQNMDEAPICIHVGQEPTNFEWVEELKSAMKSTESTDDGGQKKRRKIYIISTNEAPLTGILGLTNCLRHESVGHNIRTILVQSEDKKILLNFDQPTDNLKALIGADLLMNVFDRSGNWGSYRLCPIDDMEMMNEPRINNEEDHYYLTALVKGDLSSLRWVKGPLKIKKDGENERMCKVHCAALNFRDVMIAAGKLSPQSIAGFENSDEKIYGMDFAGMKISTGERVMGSLSGWGLATLVNHEYLTWTVPPEWSLEQASTIPTVYCTVYYALVMRGKIQPGNSILIHSGAGGIGQAAIRLALSLKCKVFVTVSSFEKRKFLMDLFPQLTNDNFADNRDSSFEDHIRTHTGGRGVDLILNSLAGDKFQASIRCLAEFGRFLEIGKVDIFKNTAVGSAIFLKGVEFHGILFDLILHRKPQEELRQLKSLMDEGIRSGVVQPLASKLFEARDVEAAFRFMARGQHMGKIVVKTRDEIQTQAGTTNDLPKQLLVPRTHFDADKCHIIVGGLGGFGLELATWMVERGAKKLALVSRSGVTTGYQQFCIKNWSSQGVQVMTPRDNVATIEGTEKLLMDCKQRLGPIGGIFNLAMVLSIDLMGKQSPSRFQAVAEPKVHATIHLDQVSRWLAPELDFFVTFSSVNSCRGSPGQANYGYANSVMERICEQRKLEGLPGLAIQWGAIADVGVVATNFGGNDAVILGTKPQRMSSCLQVFDQLLQQERPVVASYVVHKTEGVDGEQNGGPKSSNSLVEGVAHIFGIKNPKDVPDNVSLEGMGLDSIMVSEVKNFLERERNVVISSTEVRQLTFQKLKHMDDQRIAVPAAAGRNAVRGEDIK